MLTEDVFKMVVENTPLVAIDLIIRNECNEILLGERVNKPAQGFWFVPGGRIYKNETLDKAFERILKNETNLGVKRSSTYFLGVFEHLYEDSYVGENISTHYVMLVYEMHIKSSSDVNLPLNQHNKYKWFSESDLLINKLVHENTKKYFII